MNWKFMNNYEIEDLSVNHHSEWEQMMSATYKPSYQYIDSERVHWVGKGADEVAHFAINMWKTFSPQNNF